MQKALNWSNWDFHPRHWITHILSSGLTHVVFLLCNFFFKNSPFYWRLDSRIKFLQRLINQWGFLLGFVGYSLPQNPAALDKVNKIYKTNFFIFVLAHLKSSLSRYTPHSYDTIVQSLLPSKYLFWKFFCLCSHAPWSKTDESLETINVMTCVWLQG